jgi:hypothetical protein
MILGSTFEEENETTENAGDVAVSGIPAAVAMNIAPAVYDFAHRSAMTGRFYPARRYSEGVTMRVPLYEPRVNKSLSPCNQQIRFRKGGALQKHIVAGITADLYRASNLHTDAPRQNRLQRRLCPVLLPGELFRQDAHNLRVNLIAGSNHVFAHCFFERQRRRAATFRKLKRRKSRRLCLRRRSPVRSHLAAARLPGTHFLNESGHIHLGVALRIAACRVFAQLIQGRSRLLCGVRAEGFAE